MEKAALQRQEENEQQFRESQIRREKDQAVRVDLEEKHEAYSRVSEAKKRALDQKHQEERQIQEMQYGEAEGGEQSASNVTCNSPANRDVQHVQDYLDEEEEDNYDEQFEEEP